MAHRATASSAHDAVHRSRVRGGDHDKERRALDRKKALAILDWLGERPRNTPR
jgi:hypothetical protein